MRHLAFTFYIALSTFFYSESFGQKDAQNEYQAKQYAKDANRLDLQTNPDSITKAYDLHCKVLGLDKKYVPSYRSKISIEYKRGNYHDALNSAISFVTSLPDFGDAWVYLGFVQMKLHDSSGATNSFERATAIYEKEFEKTKKGNWQDALKFKLGLVQNFLGGYGPTFSATQKNKSGKTTSISMSIAEAQNVEEYVEKFMTYNGVQFF